MTQLTPEQVLEKYRYPAEMQNGGYLVWFMDRPAADGSSEAAALQLWNALASALTDNARLREENKAQGGIEHE